jgi:beta-glucosidase
LDVEQSKPIWQFGYGLSYSTFTYSNLEVNMHAPQKGLSQNVHVEVTVANTGKVDAHEVVQMYVSVPGAGAVAPALPIPIRSLQGFNRTHLKAGESATLRFVLMQSQYTTVLANGTATVTAGKYAVHVGGSQPGDPAAPSTGLTGSFLI